MSKAIKENKIRVLLALDLAKGAAPLGYISEHSGVNNPYELLELLEGDGLVCRSPGECWGLSLMPLFELTEKGKTVMRKAETRLGQYTDIPT